MRFAALDVETANRRQRSICQVAVVVFEDGREIAGDVVLVDPEDDFEPVNIGIHGIAPEQVRGAMAFPAVHARIRPILAGHVVVSHHTFDLVAIRQAYGPGSSLEIVAAHAPKAKLVEGLTMQADRERHTVETVADWLGGVGAPAS